MNNPQHYQTIIPFDTPVSEVVKSNTPDILKNHWNSKFRAFMSGTKLTFHHWISTYPFFDSQLFLTPIDISQSQEELGSSTMQLKVFDPDGKLINETEMSGEGLVSSPIHIDPFLGGCKIESGLRHARFELTSENLFPTVKFNSTTKLCTASPAYLTKTSSYSAFPIKLSSLCHPYLILLNKNSEEISVKLRLVLGTQAPDSLVTVPPLGVRFINLPYQFGFDLSDHKGNEIFGYLRINTKSTEGVLTQFFEATLDSVNRKSIVKMNF